MGTIAIFAACRHLHVGREWWPSLDAVRDEYGITEVWHGACDDGRGNLRGGDAGIDIWARAQVGRVALFPAPWELYRKAGLRVGAAGPRRIRDMHDGARGYQFADHRVRGEAAVVTTELVLGRPTLSVALPGGEGTQGTARRSEQRGLVVVRLPMVYRKGVPRVINAHHHSGTGGQDESLPSLPPSAVYIGRAWRGFQASPLANHYRVQDHGLRALELYRRRLWRLIQAGDEAVLKALRDIGPESRIVCWCKREDGSGACHGDVVVRAWEWMNRPEDV